MSNKKRIEKGLIEIIKSYLPEETLAVEITSQTDFMTDLKINSAHIVDIVLDIEDKFDIMIEDDAIGTMNTLKESIDLVLCQLSNSSIEAA